MTDGAIELKTMPANVGRGLLALGGIFIAGLGLFMLWGFGAMLLGVGLLAYFDAASDEAHLYT